MLWEHGAEGSNPSSPIIPLILGEYFTKDMRKRKVKKHLRKIFNGAHLGIAALSIFVSFCVVNVCSSFQDPAARTESSKTTLIHSALRLADAFDFYNQRRFGIQ